MRPLNPDQIDEWLEQGVIKPSVSPWASPLVLVKKKDRRTRWVTDLRELNKQTIKDSYPLPNIKEILHSLQGSTLFSSLDACGANHKLNLGATHVQHLSAPLAHSSIYDCCLDWPKLGVCTVECWRQPYRRWTEIFGHPT